jgi:hypothetical protein
MEISKAFSVVSNYFPQLTASQVVQFEQLFDVYNCGHDKRILDNY